MNFDFSSAIGDAHRFADLIQYSNSHDNYVYKFFSKTPTKKLYDKKKKFDLFGGHIDQFKNIYIYIYFFFYERVWLKK